MILGRVVGNVVATRKSRDYEGLTMLLVRPIDPAGRDDGEEFMAVDGVGAGAGETVLVVTEGRSAGDAVHRKQAPLDAAIVAIVDRLDLETGWRAAP